MRITVFPDTAIDTAMLLNLVSKGTRQDLVRAIDLHFRMLAQTIEGRAKAIYLSKHQLSLAIASFASLVGSQLATLENCRTKSDDFYPHFEGGSNYRGVATDWISVLRGDCCPTMHLGKESLSFYIALR